MANLLLVEDDASVRRLVTLQLSLVGYDVRAAEDAAAARALLADGAPDMPFCFCWGFWEACIIPA